MRSKILVPTLILAAALAAGCDNPSPTGPAMSVPAPSLAVIQNDAVPFAFSTFVPCADGGAGEVIDMSGDLHVLYEYTINDNNFAVHVQDQPQGISGTGETTGDTYQATGITEETWSGSFVNGSYEQTYINNFRMIGQGPGNNFMVHETMHLTLNANGDLTASADNFSTTCN